jgi:hypothetical protein
MSRTRIERIESALLHSKKTAARVSVRSLLPELSDDGVGLTPGAGTCPKT